LAGTETQESKIQENVHSRCNKRQSSDAPD
jgi:hypothetical protein